LGIEQLAPFLALEDRRLSGHCDDGCSPSGRRRLVFYSIKKEGTPASFRLKTRAIDDFTLKGKPRNGSIDKF
jgi:hypothetical protein